MKKLLFFCSVLFSVALFSTSAQAQIKTPAPSPTCKMTQTVGLTDVTLNYSRPGVKERSVFAADGLVPYGKVWRAGANSATKISFSDDVKVGGKALKAGDYAILVTPSEKEWTVNFYTYEGGNWSSYVEKEAAASVMAKVQACNFTENFTIDINAIGMTSANINFLWEKTMVSVPMEVAVDEKVEADIKKTLAGPSANDYYAAATYYHESGKDLNKALEWINKATETDPKFWMVRRKALILADLKMTDKAIAAAQQSYDLAKEAGNDDYMRMNEKSIKEWKNASMKK
ncbi:MAG TPA: DUF2911 domain-containing protein [Saprospiraceae bacterium]|nr:DUF2911 domain-containing protein [Saprospiraceae bacterium]HMQ81639.1 DUF2911 domain-containing protein [Saprospiraceae bacterium]